MTRVGTLSMSRVFSHLGFFVCLCWPDMVPNQRQLFIVVSDWGSYLGSHFSPLLVVGSCLQLGACVHTSSFTFCLVVLVSFS